MTIASKTALIIKSQPKNSTKGNTYLTLPLQSHKK